MFKQALLISALTMTGCATTPASTSPPPTDQLTAVANHTNAVGSQELAYRQALKTCKHWGAAPGVISSKTIDLETEGTVKEAAKGLAKDAMRLRIFNKTFPFETTITYKCYK